MNKILTQMDGEGTPLDAGRVKVPILYVQVPGGHCLGPQAVEQGYLRPARDTY